MENEKAIEFLESKLCAYRAYMKLKKDFFFNGDTQPLQDEIEVCETAIEALKKQTQIEVKEIMENETTGVIYGKCPSCGREINNCQIYCKDCGQMVKWR